ncbi:MAG: hypothetical protein H6Q70_828 [Firmicutes bacterium]|nr:hypothetical protein [Bacillota bacterium]
MSYKYAQILNNSVHWIMEDDLALTELYAQKFNQNDVTFVDITALTTQPEVGWTYDGTTFTTPAITTLTDEEKLANIRTKRDALLSACDWTQLSDVVMTDTLKSSWATYRQALRDLPSSITDLDNVTWPTLATSTNMTS